MTTTCLCLFRSPSAPARPGPAARPAGILDPDDGIALSQHRLNLFIQPEHARRLDERPPPRACPSPASSRQRCIVAVARRWRPARSRHRQATGSPVAPRRAPGDQNIAIETLALFIRYFLTVSTPVPRPIRTPPAPRARPLRAVCRTAWPPPAAWAQSARRGGRTESDPMRMADTAEAQERASCAVPSRPHRGSPHPDAAHGNGAADRCRARRPGRGGNHAQSRPDALGGSPVHGPRADGRGAVRADGERIIRLVAAHVGAECIGVSHC